MTRMITAGLLMIVALFLGGFITVGGEWFAMWQSKDWNGISAALRMVTIAGFALILWRLRVPHAPLFLLALTAMGPMFAYRAAGETAGGEPANNVRFEFRGRIVTRVEWRWDAASKGWKRNQLGTPHIDTKAEQIDNDTDAVVTHTITAVDAHVRGAGAERDENDARGDPGVAVELGSHGVLLRKPIA